MRWQPVDLYRRGNAIQKKLALKYKGGLRSGRVNGALTPIETVRFAGRRTIHTTQRHYTVSASSSNTSQTHTPLTSLSVVGETTTGLIEARLLWDVFAAARGLERWNPEHSGAD